MVNIVLFSYLPCHSYFVFPDTVIFTMLYIWSFIGSCLIHIYVYTLSLKLLPMPQCNLVHLMTSHIFQFMNVWVLTSALLCAFELHQYIDGVWILVGAEKC